MKKVLFITYYWPPSGKASIHWPLKMIKYLPEFGWQPLVLTVNKEDLFSKRDENLFKDIDKNLKVFKTNSYEPFDVYKKFTGKDKDDQLIASETISKTNYNFSHKISIWIRMNLFVPDARAGWYFPAISDGKKLLKEEKFETIISIGPPHTAHLIGMKLSKHFKTHHIPVFIDPWVDIAYYRGFKRNKLTLAFDNHLEKKVLKHADTAIFVTNTMKDDYVKKYNFLSNKSHVLYWGFNEDDFNNNEIRKHENNENEIIVHAGNIFDFQNIPAFWNRVRKEIGNGRKLKIHFIGSVSPGIKETIKNSGLEDYTNYLGFLPYNQMIEELGRASYLLVCATEKRHVPGKLFEYLRAGKPIIAFGNDNEEVKKIITEANAGNIFNYSQDAGDILENKIKFNFNIANIKKYDRKNICRELASIMETI